MIEIKDINIYKDSVLGFGSDGITYKCTYDSKKYAYKVMNKLSNSNIKLINQIEEKNLNFSIVPSMFSEKGFVSTLLEKVKIYNMNYNEKIKYLRDIKDSIDELHDNGIIHSDIHCGNILKDNKSDKYKLIDFDNAGINNIKPKISNDTDYAKEFVKKYGIKPELDIFMFNILSYSLLNDITYFRSRSEIAQKKYGVFDDKIGIEICESLLLNDEEPEKRYLIERVTR